MAGSGGGARARAAAVGARARAATPPRRRAPQAPHTPRHPACAGHPPPPACLLCQEPGPLCWPLWHPVEAPPCQCPLQAGVPRQPALPGRKPPRLARARVRAARQARGRGLRRLCRYCAPAPRFASCAEAVKGGQSSMPKVGSGQVSAAVAAAERGRGTAAEAAGGAAHKACVLPAHWRRRPWGTPWRSSRSGFLRASCHRRRQEWSAGGVVGARKGGGLRWSVEASQGGARRYAMGRRRDVLGV